MAGTTAEAQRRLGNYSRYGYKQMNRHGAISVTAGIGLSSYYGDVKSNPLSFQARPSTQVGVMYRVNNKFHVRSEAIWYRIAGSDALIKDDEVLRKRNLSFRADNFEWNVVGLLQFFNKYSVFRRSPFNPYAFAGIGVTTYNPKAEYQGDWVALRPLKTEGVDYSAVTMMIPFGVGITYHVNKMWDVSFEYGYRYTFTDYLDDVSTFHLGVDAFDDPVARALSDRRPELGLDPWAAGSIRGNPNRNDWYLITGLKVTYTPPISNKRPAFR